MITIATGISMVNQCSQKASHYITVSCFTSIFTTVVKKTFMVLKRAGHSPFFPGNHNFESLLNRCKLMTICRGQKLQGKCAVATQCRCQILVQKADLSQIRYNNMCQWVGGRGIQKIKHSQNCAPETLLSLHTKQGEETL